ncbi:hypothetical protein A2686_01560 [Candidatus Woesebacteria bacterium RIFCSPHIGHO2_01_FULL_38_10]|uniref:DUF5652 domain-containing protein n=1 Tax=Candidatus Woesebacteria bacterium RIFCSPLOWO2_01_FULL_39_10b TaxID=1802517 RepID=A0A1F8B6C5_9BACT|nr:MAG: hypothetical protein A2686_01560 [Candidatus Woesebacteria bacterium RIFCSPHIGHO2_01_FULL_38_10]OGM59583.1 MAG: hypothetical protein A2892_04525 [Candidatus Woesebacteria bacterium RIFCSPLOWO2_01_FULL_39_10b]
MFYGNWEMSPQVLKWLIPLGILDLVLKSLSLWQAARKGQKWWFIALLLVNSAGILPGVYLLTHPEKKTRRQ